jgi:RibD C-terminal domain
VDRPKVVVLGEVSVDGRLTVAPGVLLLYGDERWNTVAGSSNVFDWVKFIHKPQATLEGSGSFIRDGEEREPLPPFAGDPAAPCQDYLPEAIVRRPGHRGWFTAVDGRGRVRWAYKSGDAWPGYEGWYALVLVARQTPAAYLAYLRREAIPYLVAGEERVDLALALEKMQARLGVDCVVVTSPGRLGGALLRAGLVDEINIDFFPAVMGGPDTPSLFDAPALKPGEWPVRLKLISAQVHGEGRVWLRYQVRKD